MRQPIRVGICADGTQLYLIDIPPAELPAVGSRDLSVAWDAARDAALRQVWGEALAFRFPRGDGGTTELAVRDRDAGSWAGAVERSIGLRTMHGVSVCLRLLALVDLLCRASWAGRLIDTGSNGAGVHPTLLRLAAEMPLDEEARFDESFFLAHVQALPATAGRLKGASA